MARGDANKSAGRSTEAAAPRACHMAVAYRLAQEDGTCGTLLLATLADADAVIADGLHGGLHGGLRGRLQGGLQPLQPPLEALGCSFEAMAAGNRGGLEPCA